MRTIWIAEFSYGTPALAKINVRKETDKTLVVNGKATQIMSYVYIGKWIVKDKAHWFDTPVAAISWLIEQQEKAIAAAEESIAKGQKEKGRLQDVLAMMAKGTQETT